LTPKEIPEFFEIEAKLDIAMPQDLLNNVNAAVMATQGDNPLMTVSHAQQNLLQIGQPEEMQRAIWTERLSNLFYQRFVNMMMAQDAQAKQAALNPMANAGGAPGVPRPPVPGPQTPQGIGTPELTEPAKPFPNLESPYEPMPPMAPPDQEIPEEVL
jgi:hypothetical protein